MLPVPAIVTICYIIWRLLTSTEEHVESPAARVVFLLLYNPYSTLPVPAIVTNCYIIWRLLTH